MPSLVVFSRDPGPTNLLLAVIDSLKAPAKPDDASGLSALRSALTGVLDEVHIASRPPGVSTWQSEGYSPSEWSGRDLAAAVALLEERDAGAVLTGTSDVDEASDRHLWQAAKILNLQSHALLDHPAFLALRFTESDGALVWPSYVYVADAPFAERLREIGAPADRIRIIGDLHHMRLRELLKAAQPAAISSLRSRWGAAGHTFVILFVSDCVREMMQAGLHFDYDEVEALNALLSRVASGVLPDGNCVRPGRILIVVRPHPRDQDGKYQSVISKFEDDLRIVISSEGASHLALSAADLIAGMNSSMLYEAIVLGRTTVSLTGHDIKAGKSFAT